MNKILSQEERERELAAQWRADLARELLTHGHDVGTHEKGVVVFYNGFVWLVVGGDRARPSLKMLREARAVDVSWLTSRERKDSER